MKTYEYRKLKGRIVEKYGTMGAFAEALGLSKQSLSLKMTGKVGLSQEDIELWSGLLDIPQEEYGIFYFA